MSYLALRFDTDAIAAEAWADALVDAGALSVDIADAHAETPDEVPMYGEPGVAPGSGWALQRLTAFNGMSRSNHELGVRTMLQGRSALKAIVESIYQEYLFRLQHHERTHAHRN